MSPARSEGESLPVVGCRLQPGREAFFRIEMSFGHDHGQSQFAAQEAEAPDEFTGRPGLVGQSHALFVGHLIAGRVAFRVV